MKQIFIRGKRTFIGTGQENNKAGIWFQQFQSEI